MEKEIFNHIQKAHRVPSRRNTPRHMVVNLTKTKDKDKLLKVTREKIQIIYKGIPIRLSADFSTKTLQTRGEWHDIF